MSFFRSILIYLISIVSLAAIVNCGTVPDETNEQSTELIAIEDFFRNPEKTRFKISPEGTYVSCLSPYEGIQNIAIQRLGNNDWRMY